MATFTSNQPGANTDYMRYLYGGVQKQARVNEPTLLDFSLLPFDSSMVKLKRGAYITLTSSTYGVWYTGFIINDSELTPVGKDRGKYVWGYKYEATSDDYILNIKPLGILPPFINQTMGQILSYLIGVLTPAGFTINVSGIQAGPVIPRYVIDPNQHFSDVVKDFGDSAGYQFSIQNKAATFVLKDSVPAGLSIDGSSRDFTPAGLTLQPTNDPIINDAIVLGDIAPQNYMQEYFLGDGFTAQFPLISSVYGADSTLLLDDDFANSTIDNSKWTVYDPTGAALQPSNGFMNCLGGSNNGSFDTALVSANLIPLEGALRLTHGEFDFVTASKGVIGGIWLAQPSGANISSCVYGIVVGTYGAGSTSLNPFVKGVGDATQFVPVDYTKRYIMRTLMTPTQTVRQFSGYNYQNPDGTISTVQSPQPSDTVSFQTIITEIDPSNAKVTNQWIWNNTGIVLTGAQTFAYYAPLVADNLHCSVTGVTITAATQASLQIARFGDSPYTGYQQQIIGQNEIDSLDGLSPVATIVDQNNGATTKSTVLGTANFNPGQAILTYFKDSVRLIASTPQLGQIIKFCYRHAGAAIGHVRDRVSVALEASAWGDNGIRSSTRRDLTPLPRTAQECEAAAAALVYGNNYQHYQGTYQIQSGSWITSEPKVGTVLKFKNLPAGFPTGLQAEEITQVTTTWDHSSGTNESFTHSVSFGPIDLVTKMLGRLTRRNDVFTPQDSAEIPQAIDPASIANAYVSDVPNLLLTGLDATHLYFDTQQDPPSSGGFEVRYTDESWGAEVGKNLVGRFTTRTFSVPRNNRSKVIYVKAYDARNQLVYSEDLARVGATAWVYTDPVHSGVSNVLMKNPDNELSMISQVTLPVGQSVYQVTNFADVGSSNHQVTFSVSLKGTPGTLAQLAVYDYDGSFHTLNTQVVSLNGSWQRFTILGTSARLPNSKIAVSIGNTNSTPLYITRASCEIDIAFFETVYRKTEEMPFGAMSRFASGCHIALPLPPASPSAIIDQITNPFMNVPVVQVTLPTLMQDVYGIEVRAADNKTVLYHQNLSDNGFVLNIKMPTNNSRSQSYWVYTYNLLGEYCAVGANAAVNLAPPNITGLFIDLQSHDARWTCPTGTSFFVECDSTSSAFSNVFWSTTQKETHRWIGDASFYAPLWVRVTGFDAFGAGTPAVVFNNGQNQGLSNGAVGSWWQGSGTSWFPAGGGINAPFGPTANSYDQVINYSTSRIGSSKPYPGNISFFFYARWTGYFVAPVTGNIQIGMNCGGNPNLYINGTLYVGGLNAPTNVYNLGADRTFTLGAVVSVPVVAGKSYSFVLEWENGAKFPSGLQLLWQLPGMAAPDLMPVRLYSTLDDLQDGNTYKRLQSAVGVKRIHVKATGGSAVPSVSDTGLMIDGILQSSGGQSYNLAVIDRGSMSLVYLNTYDVFSAYQNGIALATKLNSLNEANIVILWTTAEPSTYRMTPPLPDAIYRVGGSSQVFGSTKFMFGSAYLLVGIPGHGKGNGLEKYSGIINADPNAIASASFYIVDGQLQGTDGSLPSDLQIDPTTGDVAIKGSIPPATSTSLTYTSTTTSITWTWSLTLYRTDLASSVESYSGSFTTTGLASNHVYYFYPYLDEGSKVVSWIDGGEGSNHFAQFNNNLALNQIQSRVDRLPLSYGAMAASTTAAGTGSGSGGGGATGTGGGSGGGSGTCLREDMLVEERTKGTIPCGDLALGDFIWTPEGWAEITYCHKSEHEVWVESAFNCGQTVVATPNHCWLMWESDAPKTSAELTLNDVIRTREGITSPESLKLIRGKAMKVTLTVANRTHTFYTGDTQPNVETHNYMMLPC